MSAIATSGGKAGRKFTSTEKTKPLRKFPVENKLSEMEDWNGFNGDEGDDKVFISGNDLEVKVIGKVRSYFYIIC